MLSTQNEIMQKADRVMENFYSDNDEREMYNASERYEMDKYFYAKEQYAKAIEQRNIDIARNLIKEEVPYNIIAKTTGLDESVLRDLI